jgi:ABC-type Na+ efflux pump permease subunit
MKSIVLFISGFIIALFGIATLFMSTSVIFGLFDIREKEGNYVLFVVIANFLCAFLYLAAAYGFFTKKKWTTMVLNFSVGVLVIAFIGLGIHIYSGGIYEQKTIYAMMFRTFVMIGFLLISLKYISKENTKITT